jgi:hypothetical protein
MDYLQQYSSSAEEKRSQITEQRARSTPCWHWCGKDSNTPRFKLRSILWLKCSGSAVYTVGLLEVLNSQLGSVPSAVFLLLGSKATRL